jgi:AcrR family transcriptional regulator
VLSAAQALFEERGWGGTTLAAIATEAEVSPKTVQAQFRTKARVLTDAVDLAVRGAPGDEAVGRRGSAQAIKEARHAREALALHAALATAVNSRAARLAAVVEAGAASDPAVARLWQRMRENMQFGVSWAARVLLDKPGLRAGLTAADIETVLQVAMAWGTHRTLTSARGMETAEIEAWIGQLYERMLLA